MNPITKMLVFAMSIYLMLVLAATATWTLSQAARVEADRQRQEQIDTLRYPDRIDVTIDDSHVTSNPEIYEVPQ